MQANELVGIVLVVGLVVFLVGAGGWKLAYQLPLPQALPPIHRDRCGWAWIHLRMAPAMFVTSAGLFGLVAVVGDAIAVVLSPAAAIVYALGATSSRFATRPPTSKTPPSP